MWRIDLLAAVEYDETGSPITDTVSKVRKAIFD